MARIAIVFLVLFVSGCADFGLGGCSSDLAPMTKAELFFGLSIKGGGSEALEVSEADWQRFVDAEITPRFPEGLTVEDALGQWKGANGPIHERAKHLIIVLPRTEGAKLDAIRTAYKNRFHQESVLLIQSNVCGSL